MPNLHQMNNLFLDDPLVQMYARQILRGDCGSFRSWTSIQKTLGFIGSSETTILVRTRCGWELERIAKHPEEMNCGRCLYLAMAEWGSLAFLR